MDECGLPFDMPTRANRITGNVQAQLLSKDYGRLNLAVFVMNKTGHKIDPCGTPNYTGLKPDNILHIVMVEHIGIKPENDCVISTTMHRPTLLFRNKMQWFSCKFKLGLIYISSRFKRTPCLNIKIQFRLRLEQPRIYQVCLTREIQSPESRTDG